MGKTFIACLTMVCASVASAQPVSPQAPARPGGPPSPIIVPEGAIVPQPAPSVIIPRGVSAEDAEAYRKARAEYDQCRRDRATAVRLSEAADGVINLRDRRQFWEGAWKTNETLRQRHPGGYDQMLADTFRGYRSLGGTATTVDAVRPVPAPCVRPEEPRPPSKPSPITDTKQMVLPPK